MNFIKYTRETYFKIFPNADENDFLEYEENYAEELEKLFCHNNNSYYKGLNFVAIDEEYYQYLNKLKLEDTKENMMEYINHLSDENIHRLWYKNGMNIYLSFYSLQLIIAQPNTIINEYNYPLNSEIIKQLGSILSMELKIHDEDMVIGNEACIPSYLLEHQEIYKREMTAHFMNWHKYNYRAGLFSAINRQKEKGTVQVMVRNIPICIKQSLPYSIGIRNNKFINPFRIKANAALMLDRFTIFVELLKDLFDFKEIYVGNRLVLFRNMVKSQREFYEVIYKQAIKENKTVSIN